ncbi:outer membrane beta-barrel protein [Taibaiella soli]|uniref:Outer membrane protein beta-barrel domain-containing protein n=1 Tax=Taibaiella soli TaxID=1649169 RepID=A0A2W2ACU7_9BACT|nr:outer membrane beta-barrel protein [Taibaiella soli]PZF73255.1 hypothetical protein DN068_08775 [Taibaiella soli]
MKKALLLLLLCLCVQKSYSQFLIALVFGDKLNSGRAEFGLTLAAGLSSYTGGVSANYRPSLCFGMYFSYKLNDKFSLEPRFYPKYNGGANKMTIGLPEKYQSDAWDTTSVSQKINYFAFTAMVGYKLTDHLKVCLGPQAMMRTSILDYYSSDDKGSELKLKEDDTRTRFDAGGTISLNYHFSKNGGLSITAEYYQGMVNINKATDAAMHNSIFQFAVGIPVGAGKAKKKAAAKTEMTNETSDD